MHLGLRNSRRKALVVIVSLLFFSLYASSVWSHPGRTNAEGCHTNRKTGEYHCHNTRASKVPTARISEKELRRSAPATSYSSIPAYNRKEWPHWVDFNHDCQNTRAEILIRDSLVPVKFKRNAGCTVTWGKWVGPYTGKVFTKASDTDIDHIVPLGHAHYAGGWKWTREQKRAFANDPENLLVTDAKANRTKGAKSPTKWRPQLKSYWPTYAEKWINIKLKYDLTMSKAEKRALEEMLGL